MTRQRIRIAVLGLVLLLGIAMSATAGAGDAELFVDLIPGTELRDEELDQYYGRGVGLLALTRVIEVKEVDIAEFYRERVQELISENRGEVLQQQERTQSLVDASVQTTERQSQNLEQNAQNLVNDYLDDTNVRISKIQARYPRP